MASLRTGALSVLIPVLSDQARWMGAATQGDPCDQPRSHQHLGCQPSERSNTGDTRVGEGLAMSTSQCPERAPV